MSELASILSLKGAVSQTVGKLEKKELIQKKRSKGNTKNIYLSLTERGNESTISIMNFIRFRMDIKIDNI